MKITASTPNQSQLSRLPQGKNATLSEEMQDKRLQNMQEGLKRLQEMPSPKKLAKQQEMNRVGYLQRRLDALKMMLLHASPEQAKSLARELKEIAGQLASAAKSAGGNSTQGKAVQGGGESLAGAAEEQASASAETGTDLVAVAEEAAVASEVKEEGRSEVAFNPPDEEAIDNAVMRGLLLDARKLLKEVIAMLKPKLAAAGKEAKDDLREAEKQLFEMNKAMAQQQTQPSTTTVVTSMSTGFYAAGAGFSMIDGGLAVSISSGLNISLSV